MRTLLIQYLYSGDREAIQINGSPELIYFRNLAELEDNLFLAGYGDPLIDDALVETARAREGGFGDDLNDYVVRPPQPGVYYHGVQLADFYVDQTPCVPLPLCRFLFWVAVAVVVLVVGRLL